MDRSSPGPALTSPKEDPDRLPCGCYYECGCWVPPYLGCCAAAVLALAVAFAVALGKSFDVALTSAALAACWVLGIELVVCAGAILAAVLADGWAAAGRLWACAKLFFGIALGTVSGFGAGLVVAYL
jgi:hypothetical protein